MIFRKITFKTRVTVLILYSSHDYANTYRIQTFSSTNFFVDSSMARMWEKKSLEEVFYRNLKIPASSSTIS